MTTSRRILCCFFWRIVVLLSSIVVLWSSSTHSSSEYAGGASDTDVKNNGESKCTVYMAPSTIGNPDSNLGIYTAIDLAANETIRFPEIVIPLLWREWGRHGIGTTVSNGQPTHDGKIWDRYIWEGTVVNMETYQDNHRSQSRAVFIPGVGCTVNSLLDMKNIQSAHGSIYDTAGIHRASSPGAGAFTPYHHSTTTTLMDIPAGAELLAGYGDYWIPQISREVPVTLNPVLDRAQDFVSNAFEPFLEKHPHMSPKLQNGLWNLTRNFALYGQAFTVLPQEMPSFSEKSSVRSSIRRQHKHSVEWLEEHGYCQDHMYPQRSTLPHAGYGAFASRKLPKGTIVGYAPLIHTGIHGWKLYTIEYNHDPKPKDQTTESKYSKPDLIINYSFGHPNTTVLLTPYGAMVNYINHSPDAANVRVQWPKQDLVAHKHEFLQRDPNQLRDTIEKIGLSFEYVATRDIERGEEILMNYGKEWQEAWEEHRRSWKPPPEADKYIHSQNFQQDYFRTAKEQETDPYPPNLVTMCQESYRARDDGSYYWLPPLRPLPDRIHCTVIHRSKAMDDTYRYVVAIKRGKEHIFVQDVQEAGIFLYDRSFSTDWHLENAFRHPIGIPDDILPEKWKNI